MISVAISSCGLGIATIVAEIPGPASIETGATKFVPLNATASVAPCPPLAGVMEISVGGGGMTLMEAGALRPSKVVTVRERGPTAAFAPTDIKAVAVVAPVTLTLLIPMSGPALIVIGVEKL